MTTSYISAKEIVDLLNKLLEDDPEAINQLFRHKVVCNAQISNHPTVQVREVESAYGYKQSFLGVLGLLNGFITCSGQVLIAHYDDDDTEFKNIISFSLTPYLEYLKARMR